MALLSVLSRSLRVSGDSSSWEASADADLPLQEAAPDADRNCG
jgi:hypothetical protein